MQQMNETLESLKAAIVHSKPQQKVSGEIRTLMGSLETSLVTTFTAPCGARQEFGNAGAGNAGGDQAHAFRRGDTSLAPCKVPSR